MTMPFRLANGPGNYPDADKFMGNYDYNEAKAYGNFLLNGGQELWDNGTTFSDPANAIALTNNWTLGKTGDSLCEADVERASVVIDTGSYSMMVTITDAGSANSLWRIYQQIAEYTRFKGISVVAGVRVKCATASKIRIKVDGGSTNYAYSEYHTGSGNWESLQVALTVSASPSKLEVSVEITSDFEEAVFFDSIYLYPIYSGMDADAKEALAYDALAAKDALFLPLGGGTLSGNVLANSRIYIPDNVGTYKGFGKWLFNITSGDGVFNIGNGEGGILYIKATNSGNGVEQVKLYLVGCCAGSAEYKEIAEHHSASGTLPTFTVGIVPNGNPTYTSTITVSLTLGEELNAFYLRIV